ncbi:MAG: electron transfer flavoprotein subunit alpha/FixB family protein [Actinomycetota bacterium]
MHVLVVLPSRLSPAHLEVIAAARTLGTVTALVTGDPDVATLAHHGVARVLVPEMPGTTEPAAVADAAVAAVRMVAPDAVLLTSSFAGKAVAGRLAVLLDCGAITDVTSLRSEGTTVIASKAVLQGSWATECAVTRGPAVITVKPTAFEAGESSVPEPRVERFEVTLGAATRAVTVEARDDHPSSGRPALDEARVVVAGGRGVEGDFSLVDELADVLGGAVGATRVATDEGWIDHGAQIGQTGATISPRLYVGVGVSGAIHHTAALQGAEVVVAVNSDPDAPIFELADFGVVGDLGDVLPQAIAALRE